MKANETASTNQLIKKGNILSMYQNYEMKRKANIDIIGAKNLIYRFL